MMNIKHHVKKAVCNILAAVVLWSLAVHAAALPPELGSAAPLYLQAFPVCAEPNDANSLEEAALRRLGPDFVHKAFDVNSFMRIAEAIEAEKAARRRIELGRSPIWGPPERAVALPPEPDNAALLYYQAFLKRPEPNEATVGRLPEVLRGAKPDVDMREYLTDCRPTVELAYAASQIRQCNWGIVYPDQQRLSYAVAWQMRQLSWVLNVYARTLAADGKYRDALDTCVRMHRVADHLGYDTYIMYLTWLHIDRLTLSCIQHIFRSMPPDIDTLTWLEGQLTVRGAPPLPSVWMETGRDIELQFVRTNPKRLEWWRKQVEENTKHSKAKKDILSLTDEGVLLRACQSYDKFLNSVNRMVGSDIPYVEKYAELQRLRDELNQQPVSNPVILLQPPAEPVVSCYKIYVRQVAHFNAVKVAIEIYLATAKTGRLPDTLPDHLPKDPYSGRDFEYETTEDGFVLRCRVKAIDDNKVWQYEFKVRK